MKDGYYWIKRSVIWAWEIAVLNHGVFYVINSDDAYDPSELPAIGDYIETPEKYKE